MLVIPKSTFLLRVENHKRIITQKGVKIEVTEEELKKLPGKFIVPEPEEEVKGLQGVGKKK